MNGCPATWIKDFGIRCVSDPRRLPRPPARIATGKLIGQEPWYLQNRNESESHVVPRLPWHFGRGSCPPCRTSKSRHHRPQSACPPVRHSCVLSCTIHRSYSY